MKKKILLFIFSICFVIPCMFMLAACSSDSSKIENKLDEVLQEYQDKIDELEGKIDQLIEGQTYTITYDYHNNFFNEYVDIEKYIKNYKTTQSVYTNGWVEDMPVSNSNTGVGLLEGWYIKDTNIKVENYNEIHGDITLVARWTVQPNVIYFSNLINNIPGRLYSNNSNIVAAVIPSNVKSIDDGAFVNCENLENIYYNGTLKDWLEIEFSQMWISKSYALSINNVVVTSLIIPNTVDAISDYAFRYCATLTSVTIPSSISNIGYGVFQRCENLNNIYYDGTLEDWFGIVFGDFWADEAPWTLNINNQPITTLVTPNTIDYVPRFAFDHCLGLVRIIISNNVTTIEDFAFFECDNLEESILPSNVSFIGDNAFYKYHSYDTLNHVYYNGTKEQWANLQTNIRDYNSSLLDSTIYYYSETEPTETGNYWHYDTDGVTPIIWAE